VGISSRPARKSKLLERHDLRFRAQAGLVSTIEAVVQFLNDPAAPRYGVVLEDDTALATGFARKLNARLQTTPVDWDVLHLCKIKTNQWTALPGNEHVASHGPVVGAPWPQRRDRNWRAKIFYTRALVPGGPLVFVAHRNGARRRCQRGNKMWPKPARIRLIILYLPRVFVTPTSWTGS
jgi:hypothetical protein